ncbi:STAS domain-containing protein [Salipaludibacillus agaradhaerens]|uniref:STAS domain-containing protein n=1 Tax=Salipaludibacillus agaradhaerens TaxID=76935 RepID=A0A9Q4B241_SALAG|nr:STAS domain-containing protein [Salipaludibacillus agaradhaerens]MCR6096922.1 STAS domain-containing protein [Salipaludibacillus agaradhaerens]MCR6113593.1 STAS domain-containing protein [Salipaludibacillus agaradhaerens]
MDKYELEMLQSVADYLTKHETDLIYQMMTEENLLQHQNKEQLRLVFTRFIYRFKRCLTQPMKRQKHEEVVVLLVEELEKSVYPTVVIDGIYSMAKIIRLSLQIELKENSRLTTYDLLHIHERLNSEINDAVKEVFDAYACISPSTENKYITRLNEISSPIINVTDKIAVCPLIGGIDETRGRQLIQNTLEQCKHRRLSKVIVDMSGVPRIDDLVASYINYMAKALSLIGVNITLTGVRSNVAITAIEQNVTFKQLKIYRNVQQALHHMGIIS